MRSWHWGRANIPRFAAPGYLVSMFGLVGRQVLFDVVCVFAIVTTILTTLLVSFSSLKVALPAGLSPRTLLRFFPYVAPDALRYAIPAALLFSLHWVYGRMSADNEILAAKSLGVSPLLIVSPALGFSFLLSLPTVWLTDVAVSWGHDGVQRVVLEEVEEIVYATLRSGQSYVTSAFTLTARDVEGRTLRQPTLLLRSPPGGPETIVTGEEGVLVMRRASGLFGVLFRAGSIAAPDDVTISFPDEHEVSFTMPQSSRDRPDEHFSLWQIHGEIARSQQRINALEAEALAKASAADVPAGADDGVAAELARQRKRLRQLRSKPHRRWAHGLSCLSFALFGIPWAVRSRNGNVFHVFFVGFMPVLLFYYPIEMLLASNASLPPYSIWFADALLVLCGAWLMRNMIRH